MKKYYFVLLTGLFSTFMFSQNSDTLTLGKSKREFFIKGEEKFKLSEYKKVITNPEALSYMKKSNTNGTFAQIFAAIGGGFIGYGLVKEVTKNKTVYVNGAKIEKKEKGGWGLIGIGLGSIGVAIPFGVSANKNLKKAVQAQNSANTAEKAKTNSYSLNIHGNGVSLTYNF